MTITDMLRETFARFLWTLADDLRGRIPMGLDDLIWLSGIALLGKQHVEAAGSERVQAAYRTFLGSAAEGPKAFLDLVDALKEGDKELEEALSILGPKFLVHPDPSALLTIRNALVHASLPKLETRDAQFALGDAIIDTYVRKFGRVRDRLVVPRSIGQLMATLAHPLPEEITHVPFSRLGSLLVEAHRIQPGARILEGGGRLQGFENYTETWARGVLLLRLYGIPGGFTETFPLNRRDGALADVVMACPPFGVADRETVQAMRYAMPDLVGDLPEQALRDFTSVFQALQTLGPKGRAVVVVVPGLLFRVGAVARLRAAWVAEDSLEAVISLPPGLFPGTAIASAIMVFNREKPIDRRGKVLLVAAENLTKARPSRKPDEEPFLQQISRILEIYVHFRHDPRLAAVVTADELAAQNWNLSPARYIRHEEEESTVDLTELRASLGETEARAEAARKRLDAAIADLLDTP